LEVLHGRVVRTNTPIAPDELLAWLLHRGLATEHDGLLEATARGRELAAGLSPSTG
jgi:hypothetical protein